MSSSGIAPRGEGRARAARDGGRAWVRAGEPGACTRVGFTDGRNGRVPASFVAVATSSRAALRSAVSLSEVSWRMASSMSPHFSRMEDTSCTGFEDGNVFVSTRVGC